MPSRHWTWSRSPGCSEGACAQDLGGSICVCRRILRDATARVHAGEMLQVLSNLISNALDAPTQWDAVPQSARCTSPSRTMGTGYRSRFPTGSLPHSSPPKRSLGPGSGCYLQGDRRAPGGRIRTRSSVRQSRSGTAFRIPLPLPLSRYGGALATGASHGRVEIGCQRALPEARTTSDLVRQQISGT